MVLKFLLGLSIMALLFFGLLPVGGLLARAQLPEDIELIELSRYFAGDSGAENLAYDPLSRRLVLTGGSGGELQIISLADPENPEHIDTLPIYSTSVAVRDGLAAVASPRGGGAQPGRVSFIDLNTLETVNTVEVGYKPDMVVFTPDGQKVLVVNEGEPVAAFDPEGSISVIDLSSGVLNATVQTADFTAFNSQRAALIQAGVRIFPDADSVAQDLEPENITVSPLGDRAWATLQENNALAVLDIENAEIVEILPLGVKDWSKSGLDPSSKDGPSGGPAIAINPWPVFGMYMPDGIVSFELGGEIYLLTANEGEHRDEAVDVSMLDLDPGVFTDLNNLLAQSNLGMLNVSSLDGNLDMDGEYEALYAYGGRSFSIWSAQGSLVYDSGSWIEEITAAEYPNLFNADQGDPAKWDARSQDKGPEPEAAEVGIVGGRTYGFIGLEQAGGGVLVFDLSDPGSPQFIQYVRSDQDTAPESLVFISAEDSPNGSPLLVVANEISKTVTIYEIQGGETPAPTPGPSPTQNPPSGGEKFRHFLPQLGG